MLIIHLGSVKWRASNTTRFQWKEKCSAQLSFENRMGLSALQLVFEWTNFTANFRNSSINIHLQMKLKQQREKKKESEREHSLIPWWRTCGKCWVLLSDITTSGLGIIGWVRKLKRRTHGEDRKPAQLFLFFTTYSIFYAQERADLLCKGARIRLWGARKFLNLNTGLNYILPFNNLANCILMYYEKSYVKSWHITIYIYILIK